jgi:hypothetical protein
VRYCFGYIVLIIRSILYNYSTLKNKIYPKIITLKNFRLSKTTKKLKKFRLLWLIIQLLLESIICVPLFHDISLTKINISFVHYKSYLLQISSVSWKIQFFYIQRTNTSILTFFSYSINNSQAYSTIPYLLTFLCYFLCETLL